MQKSKFASFAATEGSGDSLQQNAGPKVTYCLKPRRIGINRPKGIHDRARPGTPPLPDRWVEAQLIESILSIIAPGTQDRFHKLQSNSSTTGYAEAAGGRFQYANSLGNHLASNAVGLRLPQSCSFQWAYAISCSTKVGESLLSSAVRLRTSGTSSSLRTMSMTCSVLALGQSCDRRDP